MAGSAGPRGPAPKRSAQRRRRNKSDVETVTAPGGEVAQVPEPDPAWHHAAARWYESLARSGQSVWYQDSDWSQAWALAEVLSRALSQERMNSQLITAWLSGATELLTTEGARRRMRIELAKAGQGDDDAESAVAALNDFRSRLAG